MSIKDKLLAILSAIGGIFSAIFFVLFQQKKNENQKLDAKYQDAKEESENQTKINDALQNAQNELIKEKKENAAQKQNAHGNHLDSFNDGLDLLSK